MRKLRQISTSFWNCINLECLCPGVRHERMSIHPEEEKSEIFHQRKRIPIFRSPKSHYPRSEPPLKCPILKPTGQPTGSSSMGSRPFGQPLQFMQPPDDTYYYGQPGARSPSPSKPRSSSRPRRWWRRDPDSLWSRASLFFLPSLSLSLSLRAVTGGALTQWARWAQRLPWKRGLFDTFLNWVSRESSATSSSM